MAEHLDAPGMGLFGDSPFGGDATLSSGIAELDDAQAEHDAAQRGGGRAGGELAPVAIAPVQTGGGGMPGAAPRYRAAPLPPVIPQGDEVSMPSMAADGPVPPGGRPPGYAVPGMPYTLPNGTVGTAPGSSSKAAFSLLVCLAAAGAGGAYFKDVRGAAVGFLGTGAALNIIQGRSQSASPDPQVKQDGVWTTAASAIGLGIAAYLGYGLYKEHKRT